MERTFTKLLLLIVMVAGSFAHAKADHMVGSDIYWKCLGGDTFVVTIVDYRDCNGIPFVNSPFTLTPIGNCPGVSAKTVSGAGSGGKDITPVCGKSCTRCTDASCDFPYGIQQYFITAKVVLSKGCCDYKIGWDQCCRSAGITTGATWAGYYIESQMSRCTMGFCDNSPYFTNPPVAIYCTNQCVIYNPGANDDDRDPNGEPDSLAYSLTEPLQPGPTPVPWTGNYSYKEPLAYSGFPGNPDGDFNPPKVCNGFHLDSITGELKFKATKPDVTVIALVVSEYRRDSLGKYEKIGEIRRDMQILIIDCPDNHAPVVTGINGGNSTSTVFCAEQNNCFNIDCFDQDKNDSVTLSWNNQINGASFTVLDRTKKWPVAQFCWRPKKSDIRNAPYRFVVTGVDNACPVPGRTTRTFAITVVAPPEATYSATKKGCGVVYFQADPANGSAITQYVWTGEGSPGYGPLFSQARNCSYQYTRAGTYHYTLTVTNPRGCSTSYVDSVKIDPFVFISLPKDTTVCQNSQPITINATYGLGNKPYSITWDNTSPVNTTTTLTSKILRDTVFVVRIKDGNSCTNYDSMKVFYQKLPQPNLGPDKRGCWGHDIMLNTGLPKKMLAVSWTKIKGKDTTLNYAQGDTIYVQDSGTYAVSVYDSFGCPGHDTVNVYYNPLVKVLPTDTNTCVGDTVRLRAGIAGIDATYKWFDEIHQKLVGTGSTYKFKGTNTLNAYKFLVVINQTRNGLTCIDSGEKTVRVHELPKPVLKALPDKCIDDNAITLNTYVDAAHSGGTWYYPANPSAIVSNYLYPAVMGITAGDPNAGWVHYLYADAYRCPSDDSERINISTLPQVSAGHDTEICRANGRYILNNGYVAPGGGQWFAAPGTPAGAIEYSSFRDTVYFDPSKATVDTAYGVIYKVSQAAGKATCNNSDTVYLRVKTNPVISIAPIDSMCDNGDSIQLDAQPGGGEWTLLDATNPAALSFDAQSNTYFFNPVAAKGGFHKLKYTAWADKPRKLCSTSDSVTVYVVPRPDPVSFRTEDNTWEYCVSHGPVKLVPNKNWPGGSFSGPGVYATGSIYYFNPGSAAVDTTDSNKNVISYIVPYNGRSCRLTISHKVGVDARPLVSINKSAQYQCDGVTSFDLTAQAYNCSQVQWTSPGGQNINGTSPMNNVTTATYFPTQGQLKARHFWIYLTGSNNGKCTPSTDSVQITINPKPEPDFTADTIGCEPLTVEFHSSYKPLPKGYSVDTYDWDFGDGTHSSQANPIHVYSVTNDSNQQHFTVKLTLTLAIYKCSGEAVKSGYIEVYATPKPKIFANPQFTTIAVPQVHFDVDQKLSKNIDFNDPTTGFTWDFGDLSQTSSIRNPEHDYTDTGNFMVHLSVSSKECKGYDSLLINIKPELIIFIPNVFKPNEKHGRGHGPGDNYFSPVVNETFQPVISSYVNFEMNVYNRWGELMFNTKDPNKGWDGKYQGGEAQEGVYVYVIKATNYSGKPYTFTGSVTMVR